MVNDTVEELLRKRNEMDRLIADATKRAEEEKDKARPGIACAHKQAYRQASKQASEQRSHACLISKRAGWSQLNGVRS